MLSMTNHFDWVSFADEGDPDGKPYLQGCGCDKIMHAFGIEMEHDGGKRVENTEDTPGSSPSNVYLEWESPSTPRGDIPSSNLRTY